jgi:hypothetical protein
VSFIIKLLLVLFIWIVLILLNTLLAGLIDKIENRRHCDAEDWNTHAALLIVLAPLGTGALFMLLFVAMFVNLNIPNVLKKVIRFTYFLGRGEE